MCCIQATSPVLFLLPTFAEVRPSCSTWVTPFIPIACLVKGRMGQEGMCYVGSFRKKKKIQFFETKWQRLPEDRLHVAHYHLLGCHEFRMAFSK